MYIPTVDFHYGICQSWSSISPNEPLLGATRTSVTRKCALFNSTEKQMWTILIHVIVWIRLMVSGESI